MQLTQEQIEKNLQNKMQCQKLQMQMQLDTKEHEIYQNTNKLMHKMRKFVIYKDI